MLVLTMCCAASPILAQSAGQWHDPSQIWAASCGYCHGAGAAPELRGLGLPPQAIEAAIRRGEPAMPAFHPSEIDAVELRQFAQWLSASPPPLGSQR